MSGKNCTSPFNGSENPSSCESNINRSVALTPMDKIAAFAVICGVLFLVSVVGNALVCIVIIKRKDMRTITNLFLFNMAVSDLLSIVLFVPGLLALEISPYYWPLGEFMCLATRVISTISLAVSIFSMTVLAIERCQAIVNPFSARTSQHRYRRAIFLMFLIWLVSGAIATPQALVVRIIDVPPARYCVEDWSLHGGEMGNRVYTVVAFVVLFVIPLVVICGSYAVILRNLWRPERVLGDPQTSQDTQAKEQFSPHQLKNHRVQRKRKTTYMLLTVIVMFLICMLPFQVMVLVSMFIDLRGLEAFGLLVQIASLLTVCSMACNPIIYSFFSEKFRKAFLEVFKCRCEDSSQPSSSQMPSVVLISSTFLPT